MFLSPFLTLAILTGLVVAFLASAAQLDAVYFQHHPELHGVSPRGAEGLVEAMAAIPLLFRGHRWRIARLSVAKRQIASGALVLLGAFVALLAAVMKFVVDDPAEQGRSAAKSAPSVALVANTIGGASPAVLGEGSSIVEWLTLLVILLAAFLAWRQVATVRRVAREERTLQLHREWTDGAVAAARERLSSLMADPGATRGGATFYRLDWDDLVRRTPDGAPARPGGSRTDFDQAFAVLWFFQRLRVARDGGVVSAGLVARLFERDVAWWGAALAFVPPGSSHLLRYVRALHKDLRVKDEKLCDEVDAEFHAAPRPAVSTTDRHGS